MSNTNSQLNAIETRLLRIEEKLGLKPHGSPKPHASQVHQPTSETRPVTIEQVNPQRPVKAAPIPDAAEVVPVAVVTAQVVTQALAPWQSSAQRPVQFDQGSSTLATTLMAVGGAVSFLLAAAYFIGLIYQSGWLTPPRQIGIATVAGIGFIIAGILISQRERRYSAYLPAVGVAILYLASYAAYAMYNLVNFPVMMVTVAIVSLVAIALDRYFNQVIYSVMATVMVYLTPLLAGVDADLYTTVVYFTAWSLLFSFMSLQLGKRLIYLIAMYMAILSFDASWRLSGQPEWEVAFVFQFAQFMIFAVRQPCSRTFANRYDRRRIAAHGLPLFFFYITQVLLLKIHSPNWWKSLVLSASLLSSAFITLVDIV